VFSDVLLPVSLLFLVVLSGYRLNAVTADAEDGREDRAALLVYGVGLIVVSGAACVYVAVRTAVVRPRRPAAEVSSVIVPSGLAANRPCLLTHTSRSFFRRGLCARRDADRRGNITAAGPCPKYTVPAGASRPRTFSSCEREIERAGWPDDDGWWWTRERKACPRSVHSVPRVRIVIPFLSRPYTFLHKPVLVNASVLLLDLFCAFWLDDAAQDSVNGYVVVRRVPCEYDLV